MGSNGKSTNQRSGFTFYRSFRDAVEMTDKDDQLILYKAIADYALDGVEPDFSALGALGRLCWTAISPNIKSGLKNFQNGCAGGAPKGNQNARKTTEKQPKFNRKTSNTFIDENENGDVNGNVECKGDCKGNADKPRKVATKFVAPSLQEVQAYISEKGYINVDAQRFIDFYDSKGWMVGKNKMTKWRSAVAGWNSRESDKQRNTNQTSTSNEPKPQYYRAL